MRLLLDTHALIWWFTGDARLPKTSQEAIAADDTTVFVSAASAWEIATKVRLGKLDEARELSDDLLNFVERFGFTPMSITMVHGQWAGRLAGSHKDPFDRMLAAQGVARRHSARDQ